MANIRSRQVAGDAVRDPSSIDRMIYNEKAGARKSTNVGSSLIPMNDGAGGFTTDASTKRTLNSAGLNLAIYNNSGAVHAATVGDSTMTAQAAGAVQVGATAPFVGVPCTPNSWTYLATGQWNQVQTDSASLLVFIIDDETYMVVQPHNNAST